MSPISPSASFLLPINRRGSFFEDVFFQDARDDFHHAVQDVLIRRDRGRGADRQRDLSCYRKLRQEDEQEDEFDVDSQAVTITEDDNNRKILLDVKEFHPEGDVKVYALTDRELFVEGHQHNRKTGSALSFTRTFLLPWYADLSCGYFSVDISSDGVLRIVTTKKAPSTGRSIPLVMECEAITEDEFNQESYENNNNNNSRSSSSSRKVSMSTNGFQNESCNYTNGYINSDTESVNCASQDTMRELPQNSKKVKIIPIAFVKNESNKGSEEVSQSFSSNQESVASSNQNGFEQYSSNRRNSSSSPSNKNRLIKTVITTTFDVKSNSDQSIPAKQQEIVIPIKIEPKSSSQQKNTDKGTKQHQLNNYTDVSNENDSYSNSSNQKEVDIPIRIEPKSSGQQTGDKDNKQHQSSKNTNGSHAKSSFPIPNLVNTNQKNEKQKPYPKEFVIPLTIEGEKSDDVSFKREATKKVEIGRSDQNKNRNGKKPPINQKTKPQSPAPKKLIISSVFKGQEEQEKVLKRGVSSENKPPPIPRHERSSSIEDKVSVFTRMSPVAQRKSRRDVMDEIRGNSRGARSRSRSIEELVSKFDKMNPQIERGVLNRKNSQEEKTEILEKNQYVNKKESIIPIRIEGYTETNQSDSGQDYFHNSYSNNSSSDNGSFNRLEENENKEHMNTQRIKPIVKRKESIIPIKLEYEENDDSSFAASISDVSSSIDEMINQINNEHSITDTPLKENCKDTTSKSFSSDSLKTTNASEKEQEIINITTPNKKSTTEDISYTFSPSCISNAKVHNDDHADEESQRKSKDKTKKSSKKKVKRKQSIPGVQVSDDETGETTVLLSGRSTSSTGKNKKNADSTTGSLGDESNHCDSSQTSLLNTGGNMCDENKRTANSLSGLSKENIDNSIESSDKVAKNTLSNIPQVKDQTNFSELNSTNSSNSSLQGDQSNSCNLINSMSDSPLRKIDSNNKNISNKTVHDYSNLRDTSNERSRKGKTYKRTFVNQLVSDDSGSDGADSGSSHQSRSEFRESRASVRLSSKNRSDKSPVKQCTLDDTETPGNEKIKPNSEVIIDCTSFEIPNKNIPPEETNADNIENSKSIEVSNEKNESRRSSVLPSPFDLLNVKPPKKNKKEKLDTIESSQNCNTDSNENKNTETNVKSLNESRRASVLPNPADLLKIKPPKKNKKEKTPINESCQNEDDKFSKDQITETNVNTVNDSRRTSILPDPVDLLKIKPPKKSSNELNDSTKKSISLEDSKVTDSKVLEKISENSPNPETVNNTENNTSNLEPPQVPSLRRKTSFKKYKVFENKRTPSPSPIRRSDNLATPKPEQILINKIEESSTPNKEQTNHKKEEKPLIKDEQSSLSKNSKRNTCVTIENKDMFFSDPFFKDHRQLFMGGVREALKRSGITSMRDKLRVYRDLRLKGQTEDNQAICSAEDETSYKAVLDMTEFLEGEIKVKTMSSTEIIIEAISKPGEKSTPFSHSLPFPDSINMEGVEASLSEDGILAINAPKTNPDTED